MKLPEFAIWVPLFLLARLTSANPEDGKKPVNTPKACTIKSPYSGIFYDLNGISAPTVPSKPKGKAEPEKPHSWFARGHDYPANFTINFCAPLIEEVTDVVGLKETEWADVGAYYQLAGKTYSLGKVNTEPVFRGRKLVLNYTDGSPCPKTPFRHDNAVNLDQNAQPRSDDPKEDDSQNFGSNSNSHSDSHYGPESYSYSYSDSFDSSDAPASADASTRRKSTIISMLCERDPMAPVLTVSFVGTMDECTYFFEARSMTACGGIEVAEQPLGPGGVFGMIALVAVLVYFVGGCFYSRIVLNHRGWTQIPHYSLWAALINKMAGIIRSALAFIVRCIPGAGALSRRFQYRRLGTRARPPSPDWATGPGGVNEEDVEERW